MMTLPTDSDERKAFPLVRGLLAYFPAALAGVAAHSKRGNDKHNPGEPMHHARGKSGDHADCIVRHLVDLGDLLALVDRRGVFPITAAQILAEVDALAWRALALSQELYEQYADAPLAPGARLFSSSRKTEGWPSPRCSKCQNQQCQCNQQEQSK